MLGTIKELLLERCSDMKLRFPSDVSSRYPDAIRLGPPFAWALNSILMKRGRNMRQLSLVRHPLPFSGHMCLCARARMVKKH